MYNWKGFCKKRSWPNFKVLSQHSLERMRKTTKPSIRIAGYRSQNSNPGVPEYETGVLPSDHDFRPKTLLSTCNYTWLFNSEDQLRVLITVKTKYLRLLSKVSSLLYNGHRESFPRGKARPGRDADHSPPSSAEVVNEQELYILSPLRLHRCVVGLLYLYCGKLAANFTLQSEKSAMS
jgi:hypothetical protein